MVKSRSRELAETIAAANAAGFTISLSADNPAHADALAELGVAPVVTILPADATKPSKTPAGRHIRVCPAAVRDDINCASCGICAVKNRRAIIGFPAHGSRTKRSNLCSS